MKRIALDTDAINRMLDAELLNQIIESAKRRGVVFVLVHVVNDQVAQTKDEDRRAQLLEVCEALPKIEPASSGFVLGISRLDLAEMQEPSKLASLKTTGRGKMQDALIAATALDKADVLVTDDVGLKNRIRAQKVAFEVWTFEQLIGFLCDM